MSTTVLTIGDPHIKTNNIPEVEMCIERLTKLAEEKQPDLIIILGDTLDMHERLHTIPLNKAYELIDKMRNIAKTYILVGNHDQINHQQFLTDNHWLNGLKEWDNVVVVDKVFTEVINELLFVFSPFVPPGRFEEALNTLDNNWKEADCIFAHQEFFGCKMGAIISVEGDKWPLEYPCVVSGHIHSNQTPQKNVYYPGSMLQHAFGESSKNIISYLTFTTDTKYELDEINLNLPRKKIVYMDVENIDEYKVPENTEDKIKITVSGGYEQFKALKKTKKYKKLVKDGVKVVFKAKKIKTENENVKIVDETDFHSILRVVIDEEKNNLLYEDYELVVNNNESKVMYLD